MRDYRISIALAIPLSIALVGVIWFVKKKSGSGSDVKSKVPKSKKRGTEYETSVKKCAGREQHVDNENVTVTQRKIPETLARDRGSADLFRTDSVKNDTVSSTNKHIFHDSSEISKSLNQSQISHDVNYFVSVDTYIDNSHFAMKEHSASNIDEELFHLDNDEVSFTGVLGDSLMETKEQYNSTNGKSDSQNINKLEFTAYTKNECFRTDSTIVLLEDERNHSVESFTSLEKIQVDQLVLSALEDGLIEAKAQLAMQSGSDIGKLQTISVSEKSCDLKVTGAPIINETQNSAQISFFHCQQVDLSSKLGSTSKDASCDDMSVSTETHIILNQNMVSCCQDNLDNTCDNLQLTPLNSCSNADSSEIKSCDQSSLKISPTIMNSAVTISTPDNSQMERALLNTLVEKEDMSAEKKILKSSVALNDVTLAVDGLPCDSYNVGSTTEHFSSSLSFENFSTDFCNNYNINWSSETAMDEPSSVNLETTSLNSTVIEFVTVNEIFTQEEVSPDLGLEISSVMHPKIDTLANHASTSDSNKQASPTKSNSPSCDNNSEGSNDSGRGGSEHDVIGHTVDALVHFDFNMPSELCGRFIGKQGKNINFLKNKTGANVSLVNNPYTADFQICQVVGTQNEVDDALAMIRRKFPLNEYPLLTMLPISLNPLPTQIEHPLIVPEVMQLSLPEGVSVDVFVSAIVDAGHVFVQQPTHRSFMSLEKLTYFLNTIYGQDPNVPCVPTPVEYGIICVCENEGCWYRAMIMSAENENGETQVKFVDYGGYAVMPVSSLKQIRTDFMSLPFQAVECFMANITPNQGEAFFSEESTMALSTMTEYKLLQCQVVARSENGIPYIHLYQVNPETNSAVMINRALVNSQLVRWIEIL